ncbi:CopG family transcriptional regulator [Planktothrix sp. FACHB-1365]|uniref:ribbon-helix-helix domain-containing protein n=1 Tax=Planktothrix sp. FACHB-1365 TaxID=2692855 RepID=UPI001684FBAD|nr:CopG family transcriptional regulator [Planktothrix sp. FACHB-1365]MBD2483619.1 CopG family transcriptional regulator [Planktothrix sp. FACHB-1365]
MISSVEVSVKDLGKRKLDLISTYVEPEVKKELERWANEEERSVSWIMAKLAEKALKQKENGLNPLKDN